jgi:hypothetical protein
MDLAAAAAVGDDENASSDAVPFPTSPADWSPGDSPKLDSFGLYDVLDAVRLSVGSNCDWSAD